MSKTAGNRVRSWSLRKNLNVVDLSMRRVQKLGKVLPIRLATNRGFKLQSSAKSMEKFWAEMELVEKSFTLGFRCNMD